MIVKKTIVIGVFAMLVVFAHSGNAEAAEGGSSHYLPGMAGDLLFAVAPAPGFLVSNTVFFQSGNVSTAVLQGVVDLDLDIDLVLDVLSATYTFDTPVRGVTYTIGTAIPFGYANLDARIGRPFAVKVHGEDSFNLSDIVLTPLQLNWNVGKFHFKLAEAIIMPTGDYDLNVAVNLGRNYWSFDTIGAVTWFNENSGTEVSAASGIMVNTKNDKTNYDTGSEFHVDFSINQFILETFAIGLKGYYYKQVSDDSGSGAILGSYKSESVGIGPGFLWTPKIAGGKLSIQGKWLHDFDADNRFESNYGSFTAAWKL